MTKKNKINFLVLLGFLFLIFSCRTDEITNSQERLAREKIGAFVNFEKNLQSAKNFRTSQKSYSYPFAELIYNFLEKNKDFENDLSQKYGDIDLNVASQTFGDDEKAVVFPILKNGKVIEAIACHVNEERDYVKFRIINDKDMKATFVLTFQNYYNKKKQPKKLLKET